MISPSVGVSRPATRLSSVDLPQPDGPMTATNSPGVIVKSTPRSARTGAPSDSNVLRSPCVSTTIAALVRQSCAQSSVAMLSTTSMRYARTGEFRPLTVVSSSGSHVDLGVQRGVGALAEHDPARRPGEILQPLGEVHGVAHERVLEPLLRAEQRGGDRTGREADAEPERRHARGEPPLVERALRVRASRRGRDTARSAWSSCGTGAPKHAITASPTNCITVPSSSRMALVHLGAVLVELARELRRVGALGDARVAADVGHEHGHDELFGLADGAAFVAHLLGEPAREQPAERLALLLAVDDRLVQHAQPLQRAGFAGARVLRRA